MHKLTTTTDEPPRFRVVRLVWPFIAIVVVLLALGIGSLSVIRGVRAYVGAQSAWSNAQKAAVESLEQYAQTRNDDHFDRYLGEAAVLTGARAARLELDKPHPDFAAARADLHAARSDAADIGVMIDLYRRFRWIGFMAEAVRLWAQADALHARIDASAKSGNGLSSSTRAACAPASTADSSR